jgi:hypothetical protein
MSVEMTIAAFVFLVQCQSPRQISAAGFMDKSLADAVPRSINPELGNSFSLRLQENVSGAAQTYEISLPSDFGAANFAAKNVSAIQISGLSLKKTPLPVILTRGARACRGVCGKGVTPLPHLPNSAMSQDNSRVTTARTAKEDFSASSAKRLRAKSDQMRGGLAGLQLKKMAKAEVNRVQEIIAWTETAPTGRLTLKRARTLARRHGDWPIAFASLGKNLGEYDYISDTLWLNRKLLNGDPRLAAATLVHELTHISQHARGIPAEALEIELEAYAVHIRTLQELGVPNRHWDSFSRQALNLLKRGPADYTRWMQKQHPGKMLLQRGSADELSEIQADELERQEEYIARLKENLRNNPGNASIKARLKRERRIAEWTQFDIYLLRSETGLRRYRRFSAHVQTILQRLKGSL